MPGRTTRSIFKQGGSHLITLPREWIAKQEPIDRVHVIFDDVVVVFSESQSARVDALFEQLISRVIEHQDDAEEVAP